MQTRNFDDDLKNSNNPLIRNEWIKTLKDFFGNKSEISFKDNKEIQFCFGTDITIKDNTGRRFSVELKTKRNELMHLNSWVLELKHHIYTDQTRKTRITSKDGWLYTTTAEYIFYATLNKEKNKILEILGFTTTPFKYLEFKNEIGKLPVKFSSSILPDNNYQLTVFCLATTEFIQKNANKYFYKKIGGSLNDY